MKKKLLIRMMCLIVMATISVPSYAYFKCTAHIIVVDSQGTVVGGLDYTSDTCANAMKIAKYIYWSATGNVI